MALDPLWEDIFSSRPWGKYPAEEFIRFPVDTHLTAEECVVRRLRMKAAELADERMLARPTPPRRPRASQEAGCVA